MTSFSLGRTTNPVSHRGSQISARHIALVAYPTKTFTTDSGSLGVQGNSPVQLAITRALEDHLRLSTLGGAPGSQGFPELSAISRVAGLKTDKAISADNRLDLSKLVAGALEIRAHKIQETLNSQQNVLPTNIKDWVEFMTLLTLRNAESVKTGKSVSPSMPERHHGLISLRPDMRDAGATLVSHDKFFLLAGKAVKPFLSWPQSPIRSRARSASFSLLAEEAFKPFLSWPLSPIRSTASSASDNLSTNFKAFFKLFLKAVPDYTALTNP